MMIERFRGNFEADKSPAELSPITVIADVEELIGSSLDYHHIALEIENQFDGLCYVNRNLLFQVCLSILTNAKEVLIARKTLQPNISVSLKKHASTLCITISDNAGGIEKTVLDRMFEPYATTKALNSDGMGLYISHLIVTKKLNGRLTVTNTEIGACFTIHIPCGNP